MDRRRTGAVTKHTCLVIIELATVTANYITEAEESGKASGEEFTVVGRSLEGRWTVAQRCHFDGIKRWPPIRQLANDEPRF